LTTEFWKATGIRALRTVCQTAIAMIGTSAVMTDVNWKMVLSASALSGILSVLTSIATGLPEVEYAQHVYMSKEEPEDSWIDDDIDDYEIFDYGDEIGIPNEVDEDGEE
jgi:hypothetical protein